MPTLKGYDAAVFLADMEFGNKHHSEKDFKLPYLSHKWRADSKGNIISTPNPDYKGEDYKYNGLRIKRWNWENKRRNFIINYLKEKYPNKDYAEVFDKNNKWNLPLREPSEESNNCKNHSDQYHCDLKKDSGCYTCCYVCFKPELCQWSKCEFLKG